MGCSSESTTLPTVPDLKHKWSDLGKFVHVLHCACSKAKYFFIFKRINDVQSCDIYFQIFGQYLYTNWYTNVLANRQMFIYFQKAQPWIREASHQQIRQTDHGKLKRRRVVASQVGSKRLLTSHWLETYCVTSPVGNVLEATHLHSPNGQPKFANLQGKPKWFKPVANLINNLRS